MGWQTPLALCLWATFVVLVFVIVGGLVTLWNRVMRHADESGRRAGHAIREGMAG